MARPIRMSGFAPPVTITERKQSECRLQKQLNQERRIRSMGVYSFVGLLSLDWKKKKKKTKCLGKNKLIRTALEAASSGTGADVEGKSFPDNRLVGWAYEFRGSGPTLL